MYDNYHVIRFKANFQILPLVIYFYHGSIFQNHLIKRRSENLWQCILILEEEINQT